jgi:mannose-6-phosphate isomerase-like protein (cupin superfamily)
MKMDSIRRIITGEVDGVSTFLSVEEIQPIHAGSRYFPIWGSGEPVILPAESSQHDLTSMFPDPGGIEVLIIEIPGKGASGSKPDPQAVDFIESVRMAGAKHHWTDKSSGMHKTDTLDIALVLEGEITLFQDNDAEVTVTPGDCIVQGGAAHRWENRKDSPCTLAFVLLGAVRKGKA